MNDAASSTSPDEPGLELVTFRVGACRVGVEARQIRSSRPAPPQLAPAGIENFLELPGLPAEPWCTTRQVLIIKAGSTDAADRELLVQGPVELRWFSFSQLHPLPDLLAARTTLSGLRGLALDQEGLCLLLDLQQAFPHSARP